MDKTGLPAFNYYLDESDPDIVVLRRQNGSFAAAFSTQGATREDIRQAAMEDYRALIQASTDRRDAAPEKRRSA